MIKRLLAQSMLIIVALTMLTACPSKTGSEPEADAPVFVPDALGRGETVFTDIHQAWYQYDAAQDAVTLQSFDPETSPAVNTEVFAADRTFKLALNTEADTTGEVEYSILVSEDTVYKVDHRDNSIRLLHSFDNLVCELLPKPRVVTSRSQNGQVVEHTVLDDTAVYVVTAVGEASMNQCYSATTEHIFYELSLNFRFDAPRELRCVDEQGINANPDTCLTRRLPAVDESRARAQVVFGWVDDDETPVSNDAKLVAGLLGYDKQDRALRFYDENGEELWSQPRSLETFSPQVDGSRLISPYQMAELHALSSEHYLLQLGRDVFVFEGGELFGLSDATAEQVLDDRIYQKEAEVGGTDGNPVSVITSLEFIHDDDELFIVDGDKVFYLDYLANYSAPVTTRTFSVAEPGLRDIASDAFRQHYTFSQFDLGDCARSDDEASCRTAQNSRDAAWQFFAACQASLGCSIPAPSGEDCDTEAERVINPALDNPCTAANYAHLSELNDTSNDAAFLAFMQYADYMRTAELMVVSNELWVTARMWERDVLFRYDYSVPLSDPKPLRERIVLGNRLDHFGLRAHLLNGNLYVSSLEYFASRANECYKNHLRVVCELFELDENGSGANCTGKDLADGLCFNEFKEYKSRAVFCDAATLAAGNCNDDNLAALQIETATQDAMWVPAVDMRFSADPYRMYLLVGDDASGNVIDDRLGEGRLDQPELYPFDPTLGVGAAKGTVEDVVESAPEFWLGSNDEGRMDLLREVILQQTGDLTSEVMHFYFSDDASLPRVLHMGNSTFERFNETR